MKISEIIACLIAYHPELDRESHSDRFVAGDSSKECTGIALTCFATIDVIREAARRGCNLIITHEPTYYSGEDTVGWLENNKVYAVKKSLLEETGMVIWRDHDHMHGGDPEAPRNIDIMFYGIMKELGWESYMPFEQNRALKFVLPPQSGRDLVRTMMEKLELDGARIVGDPDQTVSRVFICEHVNGRLTDYDRIKTADEEDFDVVIPLERCDWTMNEYIVDANQAGHPKLMVEFGHFNLEEAGMKYMAKWLPDVLQEDIPVHFIKSGDNFGYVVKEEMRA